MFYFLLGFNIGCVTHHRYQHTQHVRNQLSEGIDHLKSIQLSANNWEKLFNQLDADVPVGGPRLVRLVL